MKTFWKAIRAVFFSLLVAGLFVELAWSDPAGGEPLPAGALEWDWATRSQTPKVGCTEYADCFFLRVKDTALCPKNIQFEMMFTDKYDDFVFSYNAVIESPKSAKPVVIELGADNKEVEYEYVGLITCSSSPQNYVEPL